MAQQNINIGTVANDGTGDTLRVAMDKSNDNFTELYGLFSGDVAWGGFITATPTLPLAKDTIFIADTDFVFTGGTQIFDGTVLYGKSGASNISGFKIKP
jgi:hypothetical protein